MTCLPWWHTQFAALGGRNRVKIKSGCATVSGNVQCAPENMRAAAAAKLGQPISLAEYTLARYISSEVGSGSPEDKVAVAEAAMRQSKGNVNALLLYRQAPGHPNRGWYGPIHGPEGLSSAPYKRWASTSQDPGVDDILIAKFVLSGKSENFSGGADDQIGMRLLLKPDARSTPQQSILYNARRQKYWVGPLPGVDHWHTFLYAKRSNIAPNSAAGKALIDRALKAVADPRSPDWSKLTICGKPSSVIKSIPWTSLTIAALLGVAGYFAFSKRGWPMIN